MTSYDESGVAANAARTRGSESQLVAGHDAAGVRAAVKQAREIDTTHRVYVKEWVHAHRIYTNVDFETLDEAHVRLQDLADIYTAENLQGRYLPQDVRALLDDEGSGVGHPSIVIQVRKWNVMSEWNDESLADEHKNLAAIAKRAAEEDIVVVTRNSKREHELTSYGTLKLPAAKTKPS
jgi:hypothetical protein